MRSAPTRRYETEYAAVKFRLASTYADDRERYTDEKASVRNQGDARPRRGWLMGRNRDWRTAQWAAKLSEVHFR